MKLLMIGIEETTKEYLSKIMRNLTDRDFELTHLPDFDNAKNWLQNYPTPDLIISETNLNDKSIFDLDAEATLNCPVILTAKSKEHALKAFQLNTVAYLLKPLTQKKLLEALNKFFVLKNIFTEIGTKHFKDRFFVSIGNKMLFFILDEIAFFLSEDKAVFLYTTDGRRFILDYTLNSLQSQLDNHLFFRINRNVLAKINAISCIKKHGNRQLLLTLASGEGTHNFVVSRNKVQEFKKWIGK